jgi:hypothetical protein
LFLNATQYSISLLLILIESIKPRYKQKTKITDI